MTDNVEILTADIRSRLSDYRFVHSLNVADTAKSLAETYGGDPGKAFLTGLMHDVLKEQDREEALKFFEAHGDVLTRLEKNAPKLWHAMTGAVYLKEKYGLDEEIVSAVRYHTTGKAGMNKLEKILFTADFISADRDYPGVEDMRKRAEISLETAMEEGLRFTINELSEKCVPIHPDTLDCYNEIILELRRKKEI